MDDSRKEMINPSPDATPGEDIALEAGGLQELRKLLLGGDPAEILNPRLNPEALSQALPEAMIQAKQQQDTLTNAAIPTVETAIQASVKRDINVLSEALFPIIGPATRKSISAAIGNLLQSLNQTLEYSLSPQSFKWRLEAYRTGKSFAEVVLLRTLVFQVEQVLLIHRETGLVLHHAVAETSTAQDPDLVSAMLTAIQDFVSDSFAIEPGESLDTLELGDLNLWLEEGPYAVLACVIRGTAPQDLRELLRTNLEKIHLIFGQALQTFEGDQAVFEDSKPYLEGCFRSRFKNKKADTGQTSQKTITRSQKTIGWVLAGCCITVLGGWTLINWRTHQQWKAFVSTLEQQPGLVIIRHHKHRGQYRISGLRDPMAPDPVQLLQATTLSPENVKMDWEPYLSLTPELIGQRTQALLNPPETVSISFDQDHSLHLSGHAPQQWIQRTQQISTQLHGMADWDDTNLVSTEQEVLNQLQRRIESRQFAFEIGHTELSPLHHPALHEQAKDIGMLLQMAESLDQTVQITIQGYEDPPNGASEPLSQARAKTIKQNLIEHDVHSSVLTINDINGGDIASSTLPPNHLAQGDQGESGVSFIVQFIN